MERKEDSMMKYIVRAVLLLLLYSPLAFVSPAYAASATLYMSPSSGSVTNGNTITISISEDSGSEPVNAVQANFSYPTSELQFLSINNSSAFSVAAQSNGGNGSIQIARGALPSVTGNQLVATVQFKALASSGSAVLSFTGGTSVESANTNTNILTTNTGTMYTLQPVPQSAPMSSPSPSPKLGSTPKPSPLPTGTPAAPAPPKDTPPTIANIAVHSVTTGSATLTWTTSEAASSEIDYGLTNGYGLSTVDSTRTTAHTIILNSPLIVPGTTYHFIIKATDAAGSTVSSSDQTFTTEGASIAITVLDAKTNKSIAGATITLDGKTATTNTHGMATLADLPLGNLVGVVTVHGKQTIETVRIAGLNPTDAPQATTFKLAATTVHLPGLVSGLLFTISYMLAAWCGFIVGGRYLRLWPRQPTS